MNYRGRFAPTPSGPLHAGSLLTATASWLAARAAGGRWLLRIDDLDRPRCPPGMDARILKQLEVHGLQWDESPRYQTRHLEEYRAALERLRAAGLLFECRCTRAALERDASDGPDGPVYPGTCRRQAQGEGRVALRLKAGEGPVHFDDGLLGPQARDRAREIGDFVVRRADGQIAYMLACAVDEHAQEITEVVRGADLLGSTFRQRLVQDALGLAPPAYRHLPVLVGDDGRKLSKQNHAAPLDPARASSQLRDVLSLLSLPPPAELEAAPPAELLGWAVTAWPQVALPRAEIIPWNSGTAPTL